AGAGGRARGEHRAPLRRRHPARDGELRSGRARERVERPDRLGADDAADAAPVRRDPMGPVKALALLTLLIGCGAAAATATDARSDIERVLDEWHEAAARSDLERYMELMAEDAIFLGTDATERWT